MTAAVQNAVDTVLPEIARLETSEQRAKAATDVIAAFDQGKRRVAQARMDAVAELLRQGWAFRGVARELGVTVNAVVQILNEHLGRRRRRRPAAGRPAQRRCNSPRMGQARRS